MVDEKGNIIFWETQCQWRNMRNCLGIREPICEVCEEIIYAGEIVVEQGGPHRYCFYKDPLVEMLKRLEKKCE